MFGGAFDTSMSNPLAGYAVACLIYVGAVADEDPSTWARPSTVLWQLPSILESRTSDDDRHTWRDAAARGSKQVAALISRWGITDQRRYQDNSRESLRDETWRNLHNHSAMRKRTGLPTSSSKPIWALEPHFADLFEPSLDGDELTDAINQWIATHLDASARLKVQVAHHRQASACGRRVREGGRDLCRGRGNGDVEAHAAAARRVRGVRAIADP